MYDTLRAHVVYLFARATVDVEYQVSGSCIAPAVIRASEDGSEQVSLVCTASNWNMVRKKYPLGKPPGKGLVHRWETHHQVKNDASKSAISEDKDFISRLLDSERAA